MRFSKSWRTERGSQIISDFFVLSGIEARKRSTALVEAQKYSVLGAGEENSLLPVPKTNKKNIFSTNLTMVSHDFPKCTFHERLSINCRNGQKNRDENFAGQKEKGFYIEKQMGNFIFEVDPFKTVFSR